MTALLRVAFKEFYCSTLGRVFIVQSTGRGLK